MNKLNEDIFYSKHFCILPWIHFHAWPDTKVFPCCMADSTKPISSTTEESVIKIMNTEEYKQLRLRMMNDQPSDVCQRCYDVELLGTWSLRQSQNRVRGNTYLHLVNETKEDGSIENFQLKYMDIRFSNICNMKCRSCGPSCSSLWAQEYRDRHNEATLKDRFGLSKIVVSNNEGDDFWRKLEPHLLDVEEVYFAGGEALITPEHYRILDYWLEHGRTDVRITYTTNFSVFKYKDKKVLDYWQKFSNVEIYASLDASGPLAEYVRKGTVWSDIEDNARMIKEQAPHVRFELTPTISLWNAHQFPAFHQEWINKGYLSKNQEIRLNLLTNPWYASILVAPKFYKDYLRTLYEPIRNDKSYSDTIRFAYKSVITALDSGTENKEGVKEFFHFNSKLDQHRKENILESIPELTEVYKWAHS